MLLSAYLLLALDPKLLEDRKYSFLHIPSILVAQFRTLTQVPGRLKYMLKLCQDCCELIKHWCFYIHFSFWEQKTDTHGGEELTFRVTFFFIQMPTSILSHPGYVLGTFFLLYIYFLLLNLVCLLLYISIMISVCVWETEKDRETESMCMLHCLYRHQRTTSGDWFSPSSVWVLGFTLRSSALEARGFTFWALFMDLHYFFYL